MSRTRDLINVLSKTRKAEASGVSRVENSILKTTEYLLIEDNKAITPSKIIGDIVWGMALIFDETRPNVIVNRVTCKASIDCKSIEFDTEDNLNGFFCVVTYLTERV